MTPADVRRAAKQLPFNGPIRAFVRVASDKQCLEVWPVVARAMRYEIFRVRRAIGQVETFVKGMRR